MLLNPLQTRWPFRVATIFMAASFSMSAALRADESEWVLSPTPNSSVHVPSDEDARSSPIFDEDRKGSLRTVTGSLAIVLCVFFLVSLISRGSRPKHGSSDLLEPLGSLRLTAKVELHVVRCGSRLLVLHISQDSVDKVAEIDDPDEVQQLLNSTRAHGSSDPAQVDELLLKADAETRRRLMA